MFTEKRTKINQLLSTIPQDVVLQSSWLINEGYSLDLQKYYRNSGWLKALGNGAMYRGNSQPGYEGGVYALQKQSGLSVHPGGRTALALQGKAHYIELETSASKTQSRYSRMNSKEKNRAVVIYFYFALLTDFKSFFYVYRQGMLPWIFLLLLRISLLVIKT